MHTTSSACPSNQNPGPPTDHNTFHPPTRLLSLVLQLLADALHSALQLAHHLQSVAQLAGQGCPPPARQYPAQQAALQQSLGVGALGMQVSPGRCCIAPCAQGGAVAALQAALVKGIRRSPAGWKDGAIKVGSGCGPNVGSLSAEVKSVSKDSKQSQSHTISPPALCRLGSRPPGLHSRGQQAASMPLAHAAAHRSPLGPALPAGGQQLAAVVLLSQGKACRLVSLLSHSQPPGTEAAPQQDELALHRAAQLRGPLLLACCCCRPPAGQLSAQEVLPSSLLRTMRAGS